MTEERSVRRSIRVMIVDDHFIAREGLRAVVSSEPDMEVVAEAACYDEALTRFRAESPDVTLMDVRLPGRNGIEAIQAIRTFTPAARFLVITSHDGDELIHRALAAGARAYLYKDMVRIELTAAIRAVHAGRRYIPVQVSNRLYEHASRSQITARELDILKHVADGLSNKEIAARLSITDFTVKSHLQNILSKLGASDRTHAVTIAVKRGLIFL